MKAIIVGPNGRPSILEMLRIYNFSQAVHVFTYRTMKNKTRRWYRYSSMTPEHRIPLKKEPSFTSDDTVIFWGTRAILNHNGAEVYNHPHKIDNASNKKKSRQILIKKDVNTPILLDRNDLAYANYPVIIRKDRHRAGIGFYVCKSKQEALDAIYTLKQKGASDYYISEVYPKTEEYRVHCASGKVLLVKRKPEPDNKSVIAWNFHQNELPWTTIERKNYDHEMVSLALKAVEALGLDFGAADIMSKPSSKGFPNHVIVEVNTAPSYTPYLISKYGAYFDLLFKSNKRLIPWEYKKFKAGKSLAWKNSQLKNGKDE